MGSKGYEDMADIVASYGNNMVDRVAKGLLISMLQHAWFDAR
jgi:hypothetical protein